MTSFLKATYSSASLAVLINGWSATPFHLAACSVRQGCPLSPLLFLIAIDALSAIINLEIAGGRVEGVRVPEVGLHEAHNLFADDLALIIRAESLNLQHCRNLLNSFGLASGLFCDWSKTCAALIPNIEVP